MEENVLRLFYEGQLRSYMPSVPVLTSERDAIRDRWSGFAYELIHSIELSGQDEEQRRHTWLRWKYSTLQSNRHVRPADDDLIVEMH